MRAKVKWRHAGHPSRQRHRHPRRPAEQPQEPDRHDPDRGTGRRHRRLGLRQVLPRLRHPLRRGTAPLRRDLLAVRAAVPRPHGQAAGGPHRRHPARHCDRPDQPGPHLALHRGHDDGAERPHQAALRAGLAALLPRLRPAGEARLARGDLRGPVQTRRNGGRPAPRDHLPDRRAQELQRSRSDADAGAPGLHPHPRALKHRAGGRAGPPAHGQRREGPRQRGAGIRAARGPGQGQRIRCIE